MESTGRMFFFTRTMRNITFRELCYSISSLELLIRLWILHIRNCTIRKIYTCRNRVAERAIIGHPVTDREKSCRRRFLILSIGKRRVAIVWKWVEMWESLCDYGKLYFFVGFCFVPFDCWWNRERNGIVYARNINGSIPKKTYTNI